MLTFRRLGVLVRHLPHESAVAQHGRKLKPYWTVEAHLIDELRMTLVHSKKNPAKPHPDRPTGTVRVDPERAKKLAAGRRRARIRKERIASGEIP